MTGGYDGGELYYKRVSKYSTSGWEVVLGDLNTARRSHGCGQYQVDSGDWVLIVTGGKDIQGTLSSTEISTDLGVSWRFAGALPSKMSRHKTVAHDNRVFLFGRYEADHHVT